MALQDGPISGLPPNIFGMTALLYHHGVVASDPDYQASKTTDDFGLEEDAVEILPPIRRADHDDPAQIAQLLTLPRASYSAQLYILIRLARQVESAHRGSTTCPTGLAEHLSKLFTLPHPDGLGARNSWRELYRGLSIFRAGFVWQSHLEHNAHAGGSHEVAEVLNG